MIQLPSEVKILSKEENGAVFEISPLYPGYGTTIGNTLRRVLLSSLDGAAIVSVKVRGISHEFSTIPGVLEDVIEIIMNLKKTRLKLLSDGPVTMFLKAKGEKEVTANDIDAPSDVQIINTNQHIATLTDKKAELEMEMTVERGTGYEPVEQKQKEKLSVGMITIDAIFSPVESVNFTVENIRVGQRTDYNKVLFDIKTDGTITPEEAVYKASQILIQHFQIIGGNKPSEEKVEKPLKKRGRPKKV